MSTSLTQSRPDGGEEPPSAPSTSDGTQSPRAFGNGSANEPSDTPSSEWSAADDLGGPTKWVDSIGDDAFDSERSRALFDVIDQFQSCGAGEYIDIPQVRADSTTRRWGPSLTFPQLVIVGDQSTGKSSLLRTLTDIPFPVADGCCTRFATRIVSRRTGPGTPKQVKISIMPPDFKIEDSNNYPPDNHYKTFYEVRDSLTAEEFSRIIEKVRVRICSHPLRLQS